MSRPITIVLAAGNGQRIGGPKALLAWPAAVKGGPERPLAVAHAEARLAAESARVLVVARRPIVNALLGYVRPGLDLLSSAAADELGPAGSLAFGVSRMGDAELVLVTPVDTPPAHADTVARLLARLRQGSPAPLAVRPRHKGRGGHPVALRAEALARYLEPAPPPLREHLATLGERCVDVDVDDPTVLFDLDTPLDVVRAIGAPPRFIHG